MSSKSYQELLQQLDPKVQLVAVSKKRTILEMQELYSAGCRCFGENRLDEALSKIPQLPEDVEWHFIGSLQRKKVPKVVGHFALIHSVDSLELAQKISKVSVERGLQTSILLQVNTSGELSKHGLSPDEWQACLKELAILPGISIHGLMTMAPKGVEKRIVRGAFSRLKECLGAWKGLLGDIHPFKQLSMGMSQDYSLALEEGSTMLRVGSLLFP